MFCHTERLRDHPARLKLVLSDSAFRFARIMTGNNAGDFLLGVTYPSMSEIEATYDAIASNPVAAKIYNALDVNLRTIIKVQSTAM